MEASVDLSSPKKASRPAYKPMLEQAEREIHALRTLLHSAEERSVEYARQLATAESDLLTARKEVRFLGLVALGEVIALIALLLR